MGKRRDIELEILNTERAYVQFLGLIEELYVRPLKENGIIDPATHTRLFSSFHIICKVNCELLRQLEQYNQTVLNRNLIIFDDDDDEYPPNGEIPSLTIGKIFLDLGPWLKTYAVYCKSYDAIVNEFRDLRERDPRFEQFLQEARRHPKAQGLAWNSLMIMPIQRIPRYMLLLQELLNETKTSHYDYQMLFEATMKMQETAAWVNAKMKEYENRNKIIEVSNKINGIRDLIQPHRLYRFEGEITKISTRGMPQPRTFFVFNDQIVYCKRSIVSSHPLRYCGGVSITTPPLMWVKDIPDTENFKNLFQIVCNVRTFTLSAESLVAKQRWMSQLNAVIDEAVRSNPELAKAEKATVQVYSPKLYRHMSQHLASYDPDSCPFPLPSYTNVDMSNLSHLIRVYSQTDVCLSVCRSMFNYHPKRSILSRKSKPNATTNNDNNDIHRFELNIDVGDVLIILEKNIVNMNSGKNENKWWIAYHSGFRAHDNDSVTVSSSRHHHLLHRHHRHSPPSNRRTIADLPRGSHREFSFQETNKESRVGLVPSFFMHKFDTETSFAVLDLLRTTKAVHFHFDLIELDPSSVFYGDTSQTNATETTVSSLTAIDDIHNDESGVRKSLTATLISPFRRIIKSQSTPDLGIDNSPPLATGTPRYSTRMDGPFVVDTAPQATLTMHRPGQQMILFDNSPQAQHAHVFEGPQQRNHVSGAHPQRASVILEQHLQAAAPPRIHCQQAFTPSPSSLDRQRFPEPPPPPQSLQQQQQQQQHLSLNSPLLLQQHPQLLQPAHQFLRYNSRPQPQEQALQLGQQQQVLQPVQLQQPRLEQPVPQQQYQQQLQQSPAMVPPIQHPQRQQQQRSQSPDNLPQLHEQPQSLSPQPISQQRPRSRTEIPRKLPPVDNNNNTATLPLPFQPSTGYIYSAHLGQFAQEVAHQADQRRRRRDEPEEVSVTSDQLLLLRQQRLHQHQQQQQLQQQQLQQSTAPASTSSSSSRPASSSFAIDVLTPTIAALEDDDEFYYNWRTQTTAQPPQASTRVKSSGSSGGNSSEVKHNDGFDDGTLQSCFDYDDEFTAIATSFANNNNNNTIPEDNTPAVGPPEIQLPPPAAPATLFSPSKLPPPPTVVLPPPPPPADPFELLTPSQLPPPPPRPTTTTTVPTTDDGTPSRSRHQHQQQQQQHRPSAGLNTTIKV